MKTVLGECPVLTMYWKMYRDFLYIFNGRMIYPFNKGLRIYGGGVYHPPFDTLKIGTSTNDIKLKLYR